MALPGHGENGAPGVHAGAGSTHVRKPRRSWWVHLVVGAVVVLALASWPALQLLGSGDDGAPTAQDTQFRADTFGPAGTRTQVSIGDSGALHVVETLTFLAERKRIDLGVPKRAGVGAGLSPTVSSLVVREPGSDHPVGPIGVGETASVRLDAASPVVVLEYDATGVVVPSGEPARPERALALVTPLVVVQAADLPWAVEVRSVKVLNVGCLLQDALVGCGTRTSEGWTVETSGAEDGPRADVLAQLNLPVP